MHIFDFFRDLFSVFGAFSCFFFGVKFGFRKSCLCKRNDKYEVCPGSCSRNTYVRMLSWVLTKSVLSHKYSVLNHKYSVLDHLFYVFPPFPRCPNLPHDLPSVMAGFHNLWSPEEVNVSMSVLFIFQAKICVPKKAHLFTINFSACINPVAT